MEGASGRLSVDCSCSCNFAAASEAVGAGEVMVGANATGASLSDEGV